MKELILRYRKQIRVVGGVLFVFYTIWFIVSVKEYMAAKAKYATIVAEREKREATLHEMNEKLRELTNTMNSVTTSFPSRDVSTTTDVTLEVEPYEDWDKWNPWSDWQGPEPYPDLYKVDMNDPAIDFDRFEKIYLSLNNLSKSMCLDKMMFFDILHPDMDSKRREAVRHTFKKLLAHDHQFIPEMLSALAYYLSVDGISLENLFNYAEILAPMIDATDEAKGLREIHTNFSIYYRYLPLQLEKIPDEDKRNDMLLVVKKWCPDFKFQ